MNIAAILPVKRHSERLPGKNFRILGGRPLWRWIYDTLGECAGIKETIINTDYPEAFEDLRAGDILEERKSELCGDNVPMNAVLQDIAERHGDCEGCIQVHATSPFVPARILDCACGWLIRMGCDSIFGVTRHQSRFLRTPTEPINYKPAELLNTQELKPIYEDNGAFYLFRRSTFLRERNRICGKTMMLVMQGGRAIDIDDSDDWDMAEAFTLWQQWQLKLMNGAAIGNSVFARAELHLRRGETPMS